MNISRPDSPCVAHCSTALGDNLCRGCARRFEEIAQWCFMSEEERELVWLALPMRRRGIKVAAVLGVLPEIELQDQQEWMVLPDSLLRYRLDSDVLWWQSRGGRIHSKNCGGMKPVEVADYIKTQCL
ncbi:DUF1289 domain-containing protein [Neisseriaceae bacterium TC5R-5]|nr:DUF1289 domain-containing protein [Neisseriaceae bacterium TC5R-5]